MERSDIVALLDELFFPLGFKRKASNWANNGATVSKLINLQKSYYSKSYYINYGFILKSFETSVGKEIRLKELRHLIEKLLIPQLVGVNTETEFLEKVKSSPYSSMIPLVVKEYFHLGQW